MADPVDGLAAPNGGVWVLTKDGGIRSYKDAPFHGSYPGLPAEHRQEPPGQPRVFDSITVRDDGREGYMLHGTDGTFYRFP